MSAVGTAGAAATTGAERSMVRTVRGNRGCDT
ncbi:hypothetical protein SAMN02745244_00518 [Tessaracoccus bendigoensis DSM 12906]|uniref:Uncharacterized protein n=1 Tax=Tessaracoccus bendigoensis DSM 12906 TaxID=1123357 RepID=A0A1M6BR21_9ACTN|nr:hypothetical protein SAMN02745244_00518 [Tessaracoccus bendigoensis DSM 12906]